MAKKMISFNSPHGINMFSISIVGLIASYVLGKIGLADEDIVNTWVVPVFLVLIAVSLAWWLYQRRRPRLASDE